MHADLLRRGGEGKVLPVIAARFRQGIADKDILGTVFCDATFDWEIRCGSVGNTINLL